MDSVLGKMGRNQKPIEEMYLKSVQKDRCQRGD